MQDLKWPPPGHALRRRRRCASALAALLAAWLNVAPRAAETTGAGDLTDLNLEQLMNLDVETASRFPQKRSEAPSAVTVISSADIKAYGYRTLADILGSIRGLYVRTDTIYSYLGVLGFGRPGDLNSRVLLLIDGYRVNDSVFNVAPIGTEFLLDVDLIDRVEFVPGPGSAVYGSNAYFGVINVVTKPARALEGVQASAQAGSFGTGKARATYGHRFDDGGGLVLSATGYRSDGENLQFSGPSTPSAAQGNARGINYDEYRSAFARYSIGGLRVEAAYSTRKTGAAAASYALGTQFLDPATHTVDTQTFVDVQYERSLRSETDLSARVNWGSYPYDGSFPYVDPASRTVIENKDGDRARWWGTELKLRAHPFEAHRLVAGMDYRDEYRRYQFNYDQNPYVLFVDSRQRANRFGIYVQDEFTLRPGWILDAGLRHDAQSATGAVTSPRLALIYSPSPAGSLKLLYGSSFRAPSAGEQFDNQANVQEPNPGLKPERIRTAELVLEQLIRNNLRLTASAFEYRINGLIDEVQDPATSLLQYRNVGRVQSRGAQLELEQAWDDGARLRASYSYQLAEDLNARDSGADPMLQNSPRNLVKLNITGPIPAVPLKAGLELQAMSRRKSTAGEVAGHAVTNFTLLAPQLTRSLDASISVYNVFDVRYSDPASASLANLGLDTIPQPRRSVLLRLTCTF